MQFDLTTASLLTKESKDEATGVVSASLCDLDGKPLAPDALPVSTLIEQGTGKRWGRVAAQLPSNPDPVSKMQLASILARNPSFYASDDGRFRGYYVPVADYSYHEAPAA